MVELTRSRAWNFISQVSLGLLAIWHGNSIYITELSKFAAEDLTQDIGWIVKIAATVHNLWQTKKY
jgi:hypothetical protein